jgi:O-antigen ligase
MVAVLPSLTEQVAIVLGAIVVAATMAMARAGRVLNPAWLIIAWLYLLGPLGTILSRAGIGLSTAALILVAPSPFVLAGLVMLPRSLARLLLLAPLLLLLLLAGLSLGWSPDPQYGVTKLTLWILTCLLPAASILILAREPSRVSWKLIGGTAFVYALGLLIFGAATALNPGRVTLFDANPIWAARAAFLGALVVLFGPFPSVVKLGAVPVMIMAGITTVSLGPAIGLIAGVWAGVSETLRCAERKDRRVALGWAALALLTVLAVLLLLSGALDPTLARLANDPNTTSRATYLGASLQLFLKAPVLGVGFGGFAATGLDLYPHNLVAEVASELGSLGILVLIVWFGLALRGAARSPILVALVIATATFTLFSGDLAGNGEFWMFSTLAVAMLPIGAMRAQRKVAGVGDG